MNEERINYLLRDALNDTGGIVVLTGAGISAESGIPTFRGPEGYWTVGSQVYQPQEMATLSMFRTNPRAVWQWYLYRMGICRQANPNPGHFALVDLENTFQDRFVLITQNVDNLHLRAGQGIHRTYQIHGNIFFVRCASDCGSEIEPLPPGVHAKGKSDEISETEWRHLHCRRCGGLLRPHVLWFDETYDETHYRMQSSLEAAGNAGLLLVAGTSGTTNLPNRIVAQVYHNGGVIIDMNVETNPFGQLAEAYGRGGTIRQPSGLALPWLAKQMKTIAESV